MIRFSVKSDIKQIINLWNEAFGDSEDEIIFFINNKYQPDNTLVCEIDGEIASVLFLLEGDMCIEGKDYPSYYLYAACTAKKYRGRGIMASMLDFAKKTAQNRGYNFICLMPGEKSLFDFYEKHGYKAIFKKKVITVSKEELLSLNISDIISDKKIRDFADIRNRAFSGTNFFKWNNEAVEFAFEHNKLYGGKSLLTCEGYLLYTQNESKTTVKETTFTGDALKKHLTLLAEKYNSDKFVIHVPVSYGMGIGSAEIVPSAMMIALNDEAKGIINRIDGAYLGLTLD